MKLTIERGFAKYKLTIDISADAKLQVKRFKRLVCLNMLLFCERQQPDMIRISYEGITLKWDLYNIVLQLPCVITLPYDKKCDIDYTDLLELLRVVTSKNEI